MPKYPATVTMVDRERSRELVMECEREDLEIIHEALKTFRSSAQIPRVNERRESRALTMAEMMEHHLKIKEEG